MSPFQLRIASNLVHLGRGPAGIAGAHADECGARGRTCNPLPGGFGHQPLGTMTGVRGARWTQGQAGVGNAHSTDRPNLFATSQEAWPGVAPKTTKVPSAKAAVERRQSCAPRWVRGRARRHGINTFASVGVSPPNLFVSSLRASAKLPERSERLDCFVAIAPRNDGHAKRTPPVQESRQENVKASW
jgi:hypothetical protein